MDKIFPLLARGRDRLETSFEYTQLLEGLCPLLARGRDRLETLIALVQDCYVQGSPTR